MKSDYLLVNKTAIKHSLLFFLVVFNQVLFSQVNGYGKVTAITGGTTLTISTVNTTSGQFTAGTQVIVMQMQDSTIGTRTNVTGFGNLGAIQSAGLYEVATISSVSPSALAPTSIVLTSALINTYNFNANSSVQVITYPELGSPNFTTTANITAVAWNGSIGGVVAFQVSAGILTLAHDITANASGFRGGSVSVDYYPGGTTCDTIAATYASASNKRGEKGEGIFLRKVTFQRYGKEKILNGGGGGVNINTGGGGGGNYTAGGKGGPGWDGSAGGCPSGGQGLGGVSLSTSISGTRIFMGGGGGGGQQNNGNGRNGANGGGIVIIKASTLRTTGSCGAGHIISALGGTALNSGGNDAAGGAGGGGTIVLDVTTYTIAAGCPLTISSNGGNGGGVTDAATHAGGGGGGAGAIIFSGAQPSTNVTSTAGPGTGGANQSGGTSFAQNGGAGSGIISNATTPLPIQLVLFTGHSEGVINKLEWTTLTEINNDFFTLERSKDATEFVPFSTVKGAGNSDFRIDYSAYDNHPYDGITYYRLKQTDFNGKFSYSNIISLDNAMNTISVNNVYPNPTAESINFDFNSPVPGAIHIQIINYTGQIVVDKIQNIAAGNHTVNTNMQSFAKGIYTLKVLFDVNGYNFISKVVKQ